MNRIRKDGNFMNENGVSLIEMMIVVALVGLMLVMSGGGLVAAAARQQSKTATTELAAELRGARHLAMTRRERVQVIFQPETSRVRIAFADSPENAVRQFDFDDRKVVVERLSNGPSVIFYPGGRVATPTTITLRSVRQERSQLTISLTGRVSILQGSVPR
ncbi:MAG: GspH/FimT family pseudopilin [Nitrospiraceae bacterium]